MKGLTKEAGKNQLSFDIMKSLLQKDQSLIINQFKSNRNFTDSTIEILNQTYNLVTTENKRELIIITIYKKSGDFGQRFRRWLEWTESMSNIRYKSFIIYIYWKVYVDLALRSDLYSIDIYFCQKLGHSII